LEHISDASFLGKLLVLPANVRLTGKRLPGTNTLTYLTSLSATKEKSFLTLAPGGNIVPRYVLQLLFGEKSQNG
jgi:hypothetical protein